MCQNHANIGKCKNGNTIYWIANSYLLLIVIVIVIVISSEFDLHHDLHELS